jgi:uncharacterized glyoxalase superfamily protein PhnB
MAVKPIPDGYHSVNPYLTVQGVEKLLEFLKQVFAAEETERIPRPDGSIGHAEVRIGDSVVMMGDATDEWPPMPGSAYVYVTDVDDVYQTALSAGATSLHEPTEEFYGDRMAGVRDPVGNVWWIATHTEDVPAEELAKRAQEWASR